MIGQLLRPLHAGPRHLTWNTAAALSSPASIVLASTTFAAGQSMPTRCAGRGVGDDISPALSWTGVPEATAELVLVVEDLSAPTPRPIVHALAVIPARLTRIPESGLTTGNGIRMGRNTLRHDGYSGPRPIPGHGPHTYVFQLFALRRASGLGDGFTKRDVVAAIAGAVTAKGRIDGIYQR